MRGPHPDSFIDNTRGASEAFAVALLIGIVVVGILVIVLVGAAELTDGQTTVDVQQAEQALVQFDAETRRVSTGETTTQEIDLGLRMNEGTLDVENQSGHITVTHTDYDDGVTTEVLNESLGTVTYENGETTVGYQGGGVWRSDGDGSVMVSPPEITMRDQTLTMPIIRTASRGSVYSDVQIVRTGAHEQFPDAASDLTNKVQRSKVEVVIQSRYYRAWGTFFAEETNAIVWYDHADQTVRVVFVALPINFAPEAGVIATSATGKLSLEGTGAYIDSYNSSQGSYSASKTDEGNVDAAGDISLSGDAEIAGDTHSGADIEIGGNAKINGDALANGSISTGGGNGNGNGNGNGGTITGNSSENASDVQSQPPITELVKDKTAAVREDNDNDATSVIENNELQITAQNDTLTAGRYYLDRLDLQGESLTLNTSDGDITIAVQDWIRLKDNSKITVEGDGQVRVFVASNQEVNVSGITGWGQAPAGVQDGVHFAVKKSASIDVPDDKSHQFLVLAPDYFEGAVAGSQGKNPKVTATIIAPAGGVGPGQFYTMNGQVYGGVVSGEITLGQYGEIHFDHALLNEELLVGPTVSRLEYLYLSDYEVSVKSS